MEVVRLLFKSSYYDILPLTCIKIHLDWHLVDVLQTGNEDPDADTSAQPWAANPDPAWGPIVHFDIKLDNSWHLVLLR